MDFSIVYPKGKFDAVIADATFVKPLELKAFLSKIAASSKKQIAVFLPTTSSFGEIYSLLWETFLNLEMLEKSAKLERLILELPTVLKIEETAAELGLTKIETIVKSEFFESDDGAAFVNSPLAADFLLPAWLDFLDETERKRVVEKLAETIADDCGETNFQFSVKATLLVGEKI